MRRDRMRATVERGEGERVYETIQFEIDHGVGVLTLNRPKVLNAISSAMIDEIMDL